MLLNEVSETYFDPGDTNKFVEIVKKSNKINSNYDRTDFIEKYRRENLTDELVRVIMPK